MNVFSGNFGAKVDAVYVEANRKTPLGAEPGEEHPVTVLIDESYTNAWQSEMISQTSDILVYGQPNSVLGRKTCVGGTIRFNGREVRIETFAVGKHQLTGQVGHVELGCAEL